MKLYGAKGFSLIEMAIVLLIAGLLVGGAFQLINNMQQQRTDQATANEMRQITVALQQFLLDQAGIITRDIGSLQTTGNSILLSSGSANINPDGTGMQRAQGYFENNYLNVPSTEPLGSPLRLLARGYIIGIRNVGSIGGRTVLKGVVLRTPTNDMNESRLARIAALVGSQGGLVRTAGAGIEVSGIQGSWTITPSQYAFVGANAPRAGQLASFTTTIDNQMNTNVLSRIYTGNPEANTTRADMVMGLNNTQTNPLLRDATGLGLVLTNAGENNNCGTGGTTIELLQANGTSYPTPRQIPLGNTDATDGVANTLRMRNVVLLGRAVDGSQTLLQCRSNDGTNWNWANVGSPGGTGPAVPKLAAVGLSINAPFANAPAERTKWLFLTDGSDYIFSDQTGVVQKINPRSLIKNGQVACFWSDGTGESTRSGTPSYNTLRTENSIRPPDATGLRYPTAQICPGGYYVAGVANNVWDEAPAMDGLGTQRANCGDGSADCIYIYCCPFNPNP